MSHHSKAVFPRNGHTFVVGIVARISGCVDQKLVSLDDQITHAREEIKYRNYVEPIEEVIFRTKVKGELLDRPDLVEIEAAIRSRRLDVLVMEDIGRLVRGGEASWLIGLAVDAETRVLSADDGIDTWQDGWESDVLNACAEHVGHNEHTSKRIKNKTRTRFLRDGGCPGLPVFGYRIPEGARTYYEWQLHADATPVIAEMYRRLLDGQSYGTIADYLNQSSVPLGPYTRRKTWDGKMVRRILLNPLLCGKPERGNMRTIKVNETGRRVSKRNPDGPRSIDVPSLAHVSHELFTEARQLVTDRAAVYRRKPVNGEDPLTRVPRKDSRFPGRCARCWYCGRMFVWGANGVAGHLQCNGSREWHCWNSVGIDGERVTRQVVSAISNELLELEGFNDQFSDLVKQAQRLSGDSRESRLKKLSEDEAKLAREQGNVMAAIREFGPSDVAREMMQDLQREKAKLHQERKELENLPEDLGKLPTQVADIREAFVRDFTSLAMGSVDFAHQLRKLIPRFDVYLVQLMDGGHFSPRARVQLSLDGIIPSLDQVPGVSNLLMRDLTLDLFDPPQREQIRLQAVELNDGQRKQTQIAELLPGKPTATAVQKALALHQQMLTANLSSPYLLVNSPPDGDSRLRRHKHSRYQFQMLEGYQRLPLD